uniref:SRCR domain-containing protein n=1 Tax=Mesocestoides corti TaxID=53468 RepID=A0A5K3FCL3_MESCO
MPGLVVIRCQSWQKNLAPTKAICSEPSNALTTCSVVMSPTPPPHSPPPPTPLPPPTPPPPPLPPFPSSSTTFSLALCS